VQGTALQKNEEMYWRKGRVGSKTCRGEREKVDHGGLDLNPKLLSRKKNWRWDKMNGVAVISGGGKRSGSERKLFLPSNCKINSE